MWCYRGTPACAQPAARWRLTRSRCGNRRRTATTFGPTPVCRGRGPSGCVCDRRRHWCLRVRWANPYLQRREDSGSRAWVADGASGEPPVRRTASIQHLHCRIWRGARRKPGAMRSITPSAASSSACWPGRRTHLCRIALGHKPTIYRRLAHDTSFCPATGPCVSFGRAFRVPGAPRLCAWSIDAVVPV